MSQASWSATYPASRIVCSPTVIGKLVVSYHPDRPNEPNTGAVQSIMVDFDEWHELPESCPGVVDSDLASFPIVADTLYRKTFGPYWLLTAYRAVTAAFMIGVLEEARVRNAMLHITENTEVQHMIAAAGRLGVPPLEIFMIVEGRL